MNITKLKGTNKRSGRCLLQLEGDMTIYNAAVLKDNLLEYVDDYKEFELDMSAVNEIDTSGVQLLLQFKKKAQEEDRAIQLTGCNEEVSDLLDLYQLQDWRASATSGDATTEGA
jgi:anti-sigma B factor antagonist